jgi:hypothetical protein
MSACLPAEERIPCEYRNCEVAFWFQRRNQGALSALPRRQVFRTLFTLALNTGASPFH